MIERRTGTYVSCVYTNETEDNLERWCTENGIMRPIEKRNFHSTVIYSRKEITAVIPSVAGYTPVTPVGFELYDSDKGSEYSSLVLKIDSYYLRTVHETLVELGATHEYPSYNPHITLSYYANVNTDINNLKLPDFELRIYGIMICPLDLRWESAV